MSDLTRCDDEGVPCIVQNITFYEKNLSFFCILFDGTYCRVPLDILSSPFKVYPSEINYLEAEQHTINFFTYRERTLSIKAEYRVSK